MLNVWVRNYFLKLIYNIAYQTNEFKQSTCISTDVHFSNTYSTLVRYIVRIVDNEIPSNTQVN